MQVVKNEIEKKNYEVALTAARTLSGIYYNYNQIYTDKEIEDELLEIRDVILEKKPYKTDKNCVFFYDGFGLDLRGWAASYMRGLTSQGYFVVYTCPKSKEGKIPHIISELNPHNSKVIYLDDKSKLVDVTKNIDSIFKKYKPRVAFFYTTPHDVAASIAFSNNASTVKFQIDLTDHAYWIGTNALDYILESREMGASLAIYERNIDADKIIKLDGVPYINRDKCEECLPFDIHNEEYIFTGGSLYKTLGDSELLYYRTIRYILCKYDHIKFLYAGVGDDTEIKKLINEFPERVYLINERSDFFELIKNCVIYVNSYPMFGGLMMRYAALANKVPITLKHGNDADGILINQAQLGIEFDDYQDYIDEIDKLLTNVEYRKKKEKLVADSTLTEKSFSDNLKTLIDDQKTQFSFKHIPRFDTTEFRKEYENRYSDKDLYRSFAKKNNVALIRYFPIEIIKGSFIKMKEKFSK